MERVQPIWWCIGYASKVCKMAQWSARAIYSLFSIGWRGKLKIAETITSSGKFAPRLDKCLTCVSNKVIYAELSLYSINISYKLCVWSLLFLVLFLMMRLSFDAQTIKKWSATLFSLARSSYYVGTRNVNTAAKVKEWVVSACYYFSDDYRILPIISKTVSQAKCVAYWHNKNFKRTKEEKKD